jgi:hypothetical protein
VILILTVVGLPFAFLLGAMTVAAFWLSGVFVAVFFGDLLTRRLRRREHSNAAKILIGALVVTFLMSLPPIGWLAKFTVVIFGVGTLILERRDLLRRLRAEGLG